MPDDPNTDTSHQPVKPKTENPPLDAEDWQIAFEVYEGHPISSLVLAHHFARLKEYAQSNVTEATAAIDRAIDSLYEHSQFRSVSHELFRAAVEGKITTDRENLIHQLGIRT